ncbi:zinc ABC transporter substrate-binding protein [Oceanospirillum maris]|uniref:zinc ABC transporter substrate-binding protein n=1 Tax=Oceanospirillum maris TaxID=64977 RepID=UPI000423F0D3|nr:zinc ABC transporter substrate-binding protein [Oceanospirillum maris]
MRRSSFIAGLFMGLLPLIPFNSSWASAPKVVVDIAPLHSLVTQVMAGVGQPTLLVPSEASPHRYALKPSQAGALSEADTVFWISEDLTPWLEHSLDNLAPSAHKVELLERSETIRHEFRKGATFEAHDHHDENEHHGEDDHDDESKHHGEHNDDHHEASAHHDDHEERDEAHHDEHHHGQYDPHAWLDPLNAKAWANIIAGELAKTDPEHAGIYQANARKLNSSLDQLMDELNARAEKLEGIHFIVFHDAYQYFERRFGLMAAGAISLSDASDPSPARIREIQKRVADWQVQCAFTEPQYNPRMLNTVFEGSVVKTTGVMDPLGVDINDPAEHYIKLLTRLMASLEQCQSQ